MGTKLKSAAKPANLRSRAEPRASTNLRSRGESHASTPEKKKKDTIFIHAVSEDGQTMAVLRERENGIEAGFLRTAKEGRPVDGELLKLTPRPDFPLVCDVEVQVPAGTINATGGTDIAKLGRPAQVATESYRENWDVIWSKPGKKALAN